MKRSIRNQAIENFIGEAETFLLIITNDAEINPVMAAHGYDAAELSAGNALLQVAADAFGVRLTGISGKTEKHGDLVTHDLQKFVTLAHTSYSNAAKAPWTTKMTKRNYAPARLTTLSTALDALSGSESESAMAAAAAEETTAARNKACNEPKEFSKEADGVARGAFRGNPGALTKLKL